MANRIWTIKKTGEGSKQINDKFTNAYKSICNAKFLESDI